MEISPQNKERKLLDLSGNVEKNFEGNVFFFRLLLYCIEERKIWMAYRILNLLSKTMSKLFFEKKKDYEVIKCQSRKDILS